MNPEFYSTLFILILSVYAVCSALRRRKETESADSYAWVALACGSMALAMASNLGLQSALTPDLQPALDTARFWGGAGFVYFLYNWTLTLDPWRRPTRKSATVAVLLAIVVIAVIPSHGNQSVSVSEGWRVTNWIGIALYYLSLLYITGQFLNLRAQKAVTPGLPWTILLQKMLLWIAMYMGAVFFTARILLAVGTAAGLLYLPPESVSVVQESYKSLMAVFFLLGLLPPRWVVRLVRKLEHADNVGWQSQYAVQATADLTDGVNPAYRPALVTFVSLVADRCRIPNLSRVGLLQAASLLGTNHPLASPTGEIMDQEDISAAAGASPHGRNNLPPIMISWDVARLLQAAIGNSTVLRDDLRASVLQACDIFVREAYREGFAGISTDDALRGWDAVRETVEEKRVRNGLRQVLVDSGLIPSTALTKTGKVA